MLRMLVIVGTLMVIAAAPTRGEGILEQLRSNVREADESDDDDDRHHKKHRRSSYSHHDCDDDDDGDGFFGTMFLGVVTSPWTLPNAVIEDDNDPPIDFAAFPYAEGHDGYLFVTSPHPDNVYGFGTRYSQEVGSNLDGLTRVGGQLLFESDTRLGLDTQWNRFTEERPGGGHDELWTGDVNAIIRFAQGEKVQFQTGLGFNYLADSIGSDFGINFTYGADFFPVHPWVISAHTDLGTLGNTSRVHLRTTVGIMMNRFELFTGYDFERFGQTNLQGPLLGLRLWW
ncbi:MAG: hypothetical protein R3C01_13270 [Planctomycetaceae bacterium]